MVILLLTLTVGGYFGVRALNIARSTQGTKDQETDRILSDAKTALLAWSVLTIDDSFSASYAIPTNSQVGLRALRPGTLPYPDVAVGTSGSNVNFTPSDGERDQGCATRTWTNPVSLTIRPVATTGPVIPTTTQRLSIRCFGRLPLKTLGLERLAGSASDVAGRWPWYIVSANLVSTRGECPARLDSTIADTALAVGTNTCGTGFSTSVPFPWITVLDPYGAVVSTRVAAVVIVPGPVTSRGTYRQTRSTGALPTDFLDIVNNAACQNGICDNSRLNPTPLPSTTPMTFIQCVSPATTVGDPRFSADYSCNDRLIYITVDELLNHAAKRIEREFISCLNEYFQTVNPGRYPWPAQTTDPGTSLPGPLPLTGSFPSIDDSAAITCPTAQTMYSTASYWGGWQRAASYTLDAGQASARFSFAGLPGRAPVTVP